MMNYLTTAAPLSEPLIIMSTSLQGFNPSLAMIGSAQANGCAVVTPLPNAAGYVRIAYKVYFTVTAAEWATIVPSISTDVMVKYGHILCGSSMNYQSAAGVSTIPAITAITFPAVGRTPRENGLA